MELDYNYVDGSTRWLLSIKKDEYNIKNIITVTCNGESREYSIVGKIVDTSSTGEYVYVDTDEYRYQFKFEVDDFLVGDIFDKSGEFYDSFASHVFGEEVEIEEVKLKKHSVGIESSYQHEDKEKKFPEYLVAVATYDDDSTETIGTFEPTNNIDSLKVELDGFCERINELF